MVVKVPVIYEAKMLQYGKKIIEKIKGTEPRGVRPSGFSLKTFGVVASD
jgi:hypothetical protein